MIELYRKHRPRKLTEVVGQDGVVTTLTSMIEGGKVPHACLFVGPSGTGKTTLVRILRHELGCSRADYQEVDFASTEKTIDTIRSIQQRMGLAPGLGQCRVWFLDEMQSLSRTQFAQQALLKMLEDCPDHVWFFLATTDPGKLIPTIITRCTKFVLKPLSEPDMVKLIGDVLRKENHAQNVSQAVAERIVDSAGGSARQALVDLGRVLHLKTEEPENP